MRLATILIILYLSSTINAFAYLDPGTGSIILQAIIGFLAAIGATVTLYWQRLKSFFKKISKKRKSE